MRGCGGGSKATTVEADGGVEDTHIGFDDTNDDGTDLAMEAESGADVAGSESRADVAPKDEPAGVVADFGAGEDELQRAFRFLRQKWKQQEVRQQCWADVDWSCSSLLRISADVANDGTEGCLRVDGRGEDVNPRGRHGTTRLERRG